jgi:hypothetical protein
VPQNWPELILAVAAAIVAAYLVADLISRFVQSLLRAIIADPQIETLFVDRPGRIIRLAVFLVTVDSDSGAADEPEGRRRAAS